MLSFARASAFRAASSLLIVENYIREMNNSVKGILIIAAYYFI